MSDKQFWVLIGLGSALLIVLVAVLVALILDDDGGGDTAVPPFTTTTTTEPASTSTTGAATTLPATTTTTAAPPTTTPLSTTTTAPPTTETSTTTTSEAPPAIVLGADGLGIARFGDDPDTAVAAVATVLGSPTEDSGWIDPFSVFGTCPGTEVRGVSWGDLTLLFTDAEDGTAPEGGRHLFSYAYFVGLNDGRPLGLATADGITLGSTVAALEAAYGNQLVIFVDEFFGTSWEVEFDLETGRFLGGALTGAADEDFVASIAGGIGCGE